MLEASAERLKNFFTSATELMGVLARACGHERLADLAPRDLVAWREELARLSGVRYAGVGTASG